MTPDHERVRAGHTTERVGFFTDAVFAIAMTLLVIEIPRPEEGPEFTVTCRPGCWAGTSRCSC